MILSSRARKQGQRGCRPFHLHPNPAEPPPLRFGPSRLTISEHLLHNHCVSVAALRLLLTFAPERRSASLRNRCSPSPEYPVYRSTHVLRTGSDVCYELFEMLPRLAPGVLVHFHDMFWPFECSRIWVVEENRSWNELYAVRAFLTDNAHWRVVMFNDYMARLERDLVENTYPTFYRNSGGALWIQKQ